MNIPAAALILASLALVACGANPAKTATAGEGKVELMKDKRVNCEKYTPIGSNRPKYRCLTPPEKNAEAEAGQREMRKMTAPAPSAGGIGN